jgi:hypothetical protein
LLAFSPSSSLFSIYIINIRFTPSISITVSVFNIMLNTEVAISKQRKNQLTGGTNIKSPGPASATNSNFSPHLILAFPFNT